MADSLSFYGLKVGERVCVHGHGFGRITALHVAGMPANDYVTVEMDSRECECDCGNKHTTQETLHPHPRHVSKNARASGTAK